MKNRPHDLSDLSVNHATWHYNHWIEIMGIIKKIKKWYETPTIERVTIYHPCNAYLGMSKQMQSLHAEHNRKERCMKRCMDDGDCE